MKFYSHDAAQGIKILESRVGYKINVEWNEHNSTPTFVSGKLTSVGYSSSANQLIDGIRFLSENRELFGLKDPEHELKVISNVTDELGMTHVKYQQEVNGVKIFHGQLIVHFNADGSIESVNGTYYPTPEMNTTPAIAKQTAIGIAKSNLGEYKSSSESAELNIYSEGPRLVLVYAIHLPSYSKPSDNAFIEAFKSQCRQECLNRYWFLSLEDARSKIEKWRIEYNSEKPHNALDYNIIYMLEKFFIMTPPFKSE